MGNYSYKVEQATKQGQDHANVFEINSYIVLLLADGAGGYKGAGKVSEKFLELITDKIKSGPIPKDFMVLEQIMRDIDSKLFQHSNGSETTAIVTIINDTQVWGVSVGDSQCWMFNNEFNYELTKNQYRKPLLGSGQAIPVGFGPFELNRFIVVGSDGLFNYTSIDSIEKKLCAVDFADVSKSLIELVRLPSGNLQDDCSVVIYKV